MRAARRPQGPGLFAATGWVVLAGVIATGEYLVGGVLFVLASAFDGVDGAVARASGRTSTFGAFLDSLADRYAEAEHHLHDRLRELHV